MRLEPAPLIGAPAMSAYEASERTVFANSWTYCDDCEARWVGPVGSPCFLCDRPGTKPPRLSVTTPAPTTTRTTDSE